MTNPKKDLETLCRYAGLGELLSEPSPVSGGLLHRMFRLHASTGNYAVKKLNPNIMKRETALANYINSERIANFMSDRIPVLPAKTIHGRAIQNLNGQFYLIFDWIEGEALAPHEIVNGHCRQIGGILAEIHHSDAVRLNVPKEKAVVPAAIDWHPYARKGKENCMPWAEEFNRSLADLDKWYTGAVEAANDLSSYSVISHRDLDPKNVLWLQNKPVIIDWESAGYIHPAQDLIETLIYWSQDRNGKIMKVKFFAFLEGYRMNGGTVVSDWNRVLTNGFLGKLEWLEYNSKRSLWIECADEEEQKLGTEQVIYTLKELRDYANQIPVLTSWLNAEV